MPVKTRRRAGMLDRYPYKGQSNAKERHRKVPPERTAVNDPLYITPINNDPDIATDSDTTGNRDTSTTGSPPSETISTAVPLAGATTSASTSPSDEALDGDTAVDNALGGAGTSSSASTRPPDETMGGDASDGTGDISSTGTTSSASFNPLDETVGGDAAVDNASDGAGDISSTGTSSASTGPLDETMGGDAAVDNASDGAGDISSTGTTSSASTGPLDETMGGDAAVDITSDGAGDISSTGTTSSASTNPLDETTSMGGDAAVDNASDGTGDMSSTGTTSSALTGPLDETMGGDATVDNASDQAGATALPGATDSTLLPTESPGNTEGGNTDTHTTETVSSERESPVDSSDAGSIPSTEGRNNDKNATPDADINDDGEEEGCTTDSQRNFGNVEDDLDKTIVSYRYEIETNSTYYEDGALEVDILPAVEDVINDVLLGVLFPSRCVRRLETSGGHSHISNISRRLKVMGLSPKPDENVDNGVSCTEQDDRSDNDCYVIQGGLSLYAETDPIEESFATKEVILEGMNSGGFIHAHPAIVEIRFVDEGFSNAVNADNTRSEVFANNGQLSSVTFIAMGSAVAVLIAGLVLYAWRRMRATDDASSEFDLGHDSSPIVESPPSEGKDTAIGIHRNPAAPPDLAYGFSSDSEMESSYASLTPRSTDPTAVETMMFTEMDSSMASSENATHLLPRASELGANTAYPTRLLGDDETASNHDCDNDLLYGG